MVFFGFTVLFSRRFVFILFPNVVYERQAYFEGKCDKNTTNKIVVGINC